MDTNFDTIFTVSKATDLLLDNSVKETLLLEVKPKDSFVTIMTSFNVEKATCPDFKYKHWKNPNTQNIFRQMCDKTNTFVAGVT